MGTKLILGLIFVGLLAVGGIVVVLLLNNNANNSPDTNNQANQQGNNNQDNNNNDEDDASVEVSTNASASDFLASGENKKCTYVDGEDSGTMYFSNQRLRLDFQGVESSGSMIIKQDKQYVWDDATRSGIIFDLGAASDTLGAAPQEAVDLDAEYNFSCVNWNVDESLFSPPSDVTLTDFNFDFF